MSGPRDTPIPHSALWCTGLDVCVLEQGQRQTLAFLPLGAELSHYQLSLCSPNTSLLMQENSSLLSSQCKVGGSPRMPGKGMTFPQTPAHRLPSAIVRMGCSIFRELGARVFSFPLILMLLPSQGPCARDQQALLVFVFCSFINTQTHYRTIRKC